MPTESDMFAKGFQNRKAVLGASHVEKSWENADDFNRPAQRLVTEYCWGEVWGDGTIPFRVRSMINLAMLTAMNQHHELGVHVKGALNNGVTPEEIQAVLMQAMVYCGAPAALAAFRTASIAIKDWHAQQEPARETQPE
ncbi:MAG: carboxymuconolactone decarboxylase family protein [Alphaproteobacteria bacterium]|nr:gamma carboxymuconolactone decarboxylase [Rhizobiaceae bacterium]MBU3963348.1 carboxymuconolactone decarboxylase family protein [Alphaproteobacteria bacterium]PJI41246.1 MAG: gamma carboxymuconolactone decarboxylase [Rhizobium sp.]MBU4052448.1 carboxymuconolactone decarboxylase family protein [Alphaproteobacteria bacterium]MBU4090204.1 carboxymuconolactone decarboxylase family protein [Alphaproteobacteria bacterium]